MKNLWDVFIPPKLSIFAWRITQDRIATASKLSNMKLLHSPVCTGCIIGVPETIDHIMLNCCHARNMWCWLSDLFHFDFTNFSSTLDLIRWACRQRNKDGIGQLRKLSVLSTFWMLWKYRNYRIFEGKITLQQSAIEGLRRQITKSAFLVKGKIRNNQEELLILKFFGVHPTFVRAKELKGVNWVLPPPSWIKVNTDGSARGNPGEAACGGIFRMSRGFVKGLFALPLGIQTSLFAEIMGFITAVEIASKKGWFPLWIETDSLVLVQKVRTQSFDVPWGVRVRWKKCLSILKDKTFSITHVFREGNQVADRMANYGHSLSDITWWYEVPDVAFNAYVRNLSGVTEFRISD